MIKQRIENADVNESEPEKKRLHMEKTTLLTKNNSQPVDNAILTLLSDNTKLVDKSNYTDIGLLSSVSNNNTNQLVSLSKRQQKKLHKLAQWEIKKKTKRLKEREKYKQKRLEAIANGKPTRTGPSRKELKRRKMDDSLNPFNVVIDLDFDDLMIDKDICKLTKQLLWVYTINRKSSQPLHLYYTSLKMGSRLQQSLERNDGYQNWDVKINEQSYMELFAKEKIVYLTSDAEEILTKLDESCIYIIGGLVDHNHYKGLTYQRAGERGLRTARLPLSENVSLKTRTVLTIVHVFDVLLRVSQGMSWQEALLQVLPLRKGAKPLMVGKNVNETIDNCDKILDEACEHC